MTASPASTTTAIKMTFFMGASFGWRVGDYILAGGAARGHRCVLREAFGFVRFRVARDVRSNGTCANVVYSSPRIVRAVVILMCFSHVAELRFCGEKDDGKLPAVYTTCEGLYTKPRAALAWLKGAARMPVRYTYSPKSGV